MKLYFGLEYEEYKESFFHPFIAFFNHLMKDEGGYLPGEQARKLKDRGGATKYGISLRFLQGLDIDTADFNNDGVVDEKDIVVLNMEQAKELYFKFFYNPLYNKIDNVQLANRIFNFGVNAGKRTSVKLLQYTCNEVIRSPLLKIDGFFGSKTLAAVNNLQSDKLYDSYIINITEYYKSLNKPQFIDGWLARLKKLLPKHWVLGIENWKRKKDENILDEVL